MARRLGTLVNQQVLRWNRQQRAGDSVPPPLVPIEEQRPMICISREFGALGGEVGKIVARRLGFSFYAQELVHEIAERARVRPHLVESLDERWEEGVQAWLSEWIEGGGFAPSDYLRNLSKVVLTLGRQGRGVVIGRGAHLMLAAHRTLRIRTYAPLDQRIDYIVRRDGLAPALARAKVLRVDAERTQFYRQQFGVAVEDPSHFDLLLNMGVFGLEQAADVVVRAFHARFSNESSARAASEPPPRSHVRARIPARE